MKNITGLKYGKLLIIEDKGEKDGRRKSRVVTTQCECGTIKKLPRAPFLCGSNAMKCFKCHLKHMKTMYGIVNKIR